MAKRTIKITEYVKEIIQDIFSKAYLTGQAREADGVTYQQASNMQASEEDEEKYQIVRSIGNAFSSLKTSLSEYLAEDRTDSDNRLLSEIVENGELVFIFQLPANYNDTAIDGLADGIHSYLVSMTLSDWFSITNKADAEIYNRQAMVSMVNIKRALYRRRRPNRPKFLKG